MQTALCLIVVRVPRGRRNDVGTFDEQLDELGQGLRRIASVGINRANKGSTGIQQTGSNCCAKPKIFWMVGNLGPSEMSACFVEQRAGSIVRSIVDEHDLPTRLSFDQDSESLDQRRNGLFLVIARDYN